ncbi:MAG: AAA domain-containing protein [Candidatus Cloacimonetes bacterium]|nr:AAA domain-containing protein [Candidatus Cloacimonadota bacterium]
MEKRKLPLQKLFMYIRDLYNVIDISPEFTKENNNHKVEKENYWSLDYLMDIAAKCQKRKIKEFQFSISDSLDKSGSEDILLRIKPCTNIPSEPVPPDVLLPWLIYERKAKERPRIALKTVEEYYKNNEDLLPITQDSKESDTSKDATPLKDNSELSSEKYSVRLREKVIDFPKRGIREEYTHPTEIMSQFERFSEEYENYYNEYWHYFVINDIYQALHTLYHELNRKKDKQLFLSFALLSGKIGGQNYRNFVFHIPLIFRLKNRAIEILMDPLTSNVECEANFIHLLDKHFEHKSENFRSNIKQDFAKFVNDFNSQKHAFVFDAEFIHAHFMENMQSMLSFFPNSRFISTKEYSPKEQDQYFEREDEPPLNITFFADIPHDGIQFSFSPIIQSRIVDNFSLISQDAARIVRKIDEVEKAGKGHEIPTIFKKEFFVSQEVTNDHEADKWQNDGDYLFPLPYNNEQLDIVKKLQNQDVVRVQGPPGTGKSHTIANIISHFVAEGKSIMVVSKNSKALSVIKEKLPKEIQDLAATLLGDGRSNEALIQSVKSIIHHLSSSYSQEELYEILKRRLALKQKYESLKEDFITRIEQNQKRYQIEKIPAVLERRFEKELDKEKKVSAATLAEIYAEHISLENPIKDKIDWQSAGEDAVKKLKKLLSYKNHLQKEEYPLIKYEYPPLDVWLFPKDRNTLQNNMLMISDKIDFKSYASIPYQDFDKNFFEILGRLKNNIEEIKKDDLALKIMNASGFDAKLCLTVFKPFKEHIKNIKNNESIRFGYKIEAPPDEIANPDFILTALSKLIYRHGEKQKLNAIRRFLLPKEQKMLYRYRINDAYASTRTDFELLQKYYEDKSRLKAMHIIADNYLKKMNIENQLSQLEDFAPFRKIYEYLKDLTDINMILEGRPIAEVSHSIDKNEKSIQFLIDYKKYQEYCENAKKLKECADKNMRFKKTHPIFVKLVQSITDIDSQDYEQYYREYKDLVENTYPKLVDYKESLEALKKVLPQTAQHIHKLFCKGAELISSSRAELAYFLARIYNLLIQCEDKIGNIEDVIRELHKIRNEIMNMNTKAVAYKTWLTKSQIITDEQKTHLNAWRNDLVNIGKGYGKNTAKNRASAIRNMEKAKGAVPIWITTIFNAITFFKDVTPSHIDLLIIDEASQCDISSLNLAFRCKKQIIVGDENQTAVAVDSRKFSKDRIDILLDQHLNEHKHKRQFSIGEKNNSIYSLSTILHSDNQIALSEHFRSLPEIISFSNKLVYDNHIVPLKTCAEYPYGMPVESYYILDNPKNQARPIIVESAVKYIEDILAKLDEHEDIPTFGILCLDSSNLKHQKALIKRVAQSELIRKYEEKLDLIVGTSREFQGDERDIMIMTITATSAVLDEAGNITHSVPDKISGEEIKRIYNVAASRAKYKSVLFHSVHEEVVPHMKPDCWRKMLLEYYGNIKPSYEINRNNIEDIKDKVNTELGRFGEEVCVFLCESGYQYCISPGFTLGKYKIDFALLISGKTLAIQCDGQDPLLEHENLKEAYERQNIVKSLQEQMVLGRVGWRIYRIQKLQWYFQNEKSKKELLDWIARFIPPKTLD